MCTNSIWTHVYGYTCIYRSACVWVLTVGFLPSLSTVFRLSTPCTVTAPGYKWTASSSDSAELQQDKRQTLQAIHTNIHTGKHACSHARTPDQIKRWTSSKGGRNLLSHLKFCFVNLSFFFLKLHLFLSCFHRTEFHRYKSWHWYLRKEEQRRTRWCTDCVCLEDQSRKPSAGAQWSLVERERKRPIPNRKGRLMCNFHENWL